MTTMSQLRGVLEPVDHLLALHRLTAPPIQSFDRSSASCHRARSASACARGHRRLEPPVDAPLPGDLLRPTTRSRPPAPPGTPRRARWSRSRPAARPGTPSRSAWNCISASLVDAPPSTRSSASAMPAVAVDRVEQVGHLVRDALDGGARDVAGGRAARDADDGAARVGVPVRRAESREGRHQVDAAVVGHRRRQAPRRPTTSG